MSKKEYFNLGSSEHSILAKKIKENNYDYDPNKYVFDANLKNDSHAAVIRQIAENSSVLDVGCASGIIGSILTKYKKCTVDGIEYDKKAAEITKSKGLYRNVFNFSIVDVDSKEYKSFEKLKTKYDYIIFADVLEHLTNPWEAIVNLSKHLNENGSFIISVPNLSHLDIIRAVINGEFNYTNHGILDSTHLRFFTAKSFVEMIENIEKEYHINFDIEYCENVLIKPPYFKDDQDYKLFNLDGKLEDYLCLQNIFKLTLTKGKGKRNINFVTHDNYFELMNEKFKSMVNELHEKNLEIESLRKNLNDITNSRSYKFSKKVSSIIHK